MVRTSGLCAATVPRSSFLPSWSRSSFASLPKGIEPCRSIAYCETCLWGPEEVSRLTAAYEQALRRIGVVDRDDPLAEMVAKKVINISQSGVRDPAEIAALAIKELGVQ
jgi:hypothetical protein